MSGRLFSQSRSWSQRFTMTFRSTLRIFVNDDARKKNKGILKAKNYGIFIVLFSRVEILHKFATKKQASFPIYESR